MVKGEKWKGNYNVERSTEWDSCRSSLWKFSYAESAKCLPRMGKPRERYEGRRGPRPYPGWRRQRLRPCCIYHIITIIELEPRSSFLLPSLYPPYQEERYNPTATTKTTTWNHPDSAASKPSPLSRPPQPQIGNSRIHFHCCLGTTLGFYLTFHPFVFSDLIRSRVPSTSTINGLDRLTHRLIYIGIVHSWIFFLF